MSAFDNFTYEDATTALNAFEDAGALSSRAFLSGDHWQAGDVWIGPKPKSTESTYRDVMGEIERGLVSKNIVKEVTDRHLAGVIGREPPWSLTVRRPLKLIEQDGKRVQEKPDEAEQALIDEAEAGLTELWDVRRALTHVYKAGENLLTSGRAHLRLFVPDGSQVKSVPRGDISAALKKLYINVPLPEQAAVITDVKTQQKAALYLYEEEIKGADGKTTTEKRLELAYVDDSGKTVIKILNDKGNVVSVDSKEQQDARDFGGHLPLVEMERDALITAQVRQHQALLNMARTMMGRNVVLGGFLERVFLNAQMPGEWVEENGQKVFKPNPFYTGVGTTNFLVGTKTENPDGSTSYASPSVVYRDPVDVKTFVDTASEAYSGILEETKQLHALIAGDATASGESRKQAMDDFEKSLWPTKAQIDAAGRAILEAALAMAAEFAGVPGRFKDLRVVFDCEIDVGEPPSEWVNTALTLVEKKVWKRARLQALTGVEDTDAEDAAIAADEEKLNPTGVIRRERMKLNLERDRAAGDEEDAMRRRIEEGAREKELVQ